MNKIILLLSILIASIVSANATDNNWGRSVRGNGNVTKENRDIEPFDGIKASAGINVYLFEGNEEKVIVETDENLQECIITEVKGSTLKCYPDCSIRRSTKMNVYVTFRELNKIHASSGSDVVGETPINARELDIDASSAADIKVEVKAETIYCNASSGADAVIKGKAGHFRGRASSGADIKAEDLVVETCDANSSSGADIRITVTKSIEADASSGGDVVYYGNPERENVRESSGGDVHRR
ncbi:MAG: DUF2807 domain-containing protein [Prolixibacteraceae bacterium]|nr:DUF2807 domain-containing protein [Prolixibacteraceae bacterium]